MLGYYAQKIQQPQEGEATLLFHLLEEKNKKQLEILIYEDNRYIQITESHFSNNSITANATFYLDGEKPYPISLTWNGSALVGQVELPFLGSLRVYATPWQGKTKRDLMCETLLLMPHPEIPKRTQQEINDLVQKLMNQMTLREKIGQMNQSLGMNTSALGATTTTLSIEEHIAAGDVGLILGAGGFGDQAYFLQKTAVENSRLRIPLMFNADVIHGFETIFPIPLAWSCSFDPERIKLACEIAAKEASATGIMYNHGPMVDISRDPRWGRVSEGAGEDPFLGSVLASAQVEGFQHGGIDNKQSILACLKHFVGYGAGEGGRDYNTVEISDTTLMNTYIPPFKAGIDAGASSVMNAFNIMNGIPMAANRHLLKDLLRQKLGFDGMIISDFGSIEEIMIHGCATDLKEATEKSLHASMDIEMVSTLYREYLETLLKENKIQMKQIDEAVARILTFKYATGLMDDPFRYFRPKDVEQLTFSREHLSHSLDLAKRSIVLLKNEGILPLTDPSKKIALIGPLGNSKDLLGPWQFSSHQQDTPTIYDGLISKGFCVQLEMGSNILTAISAGIDHAIKAAMSADVVILSLGESSDMSGEAASRMDICLPAPQIELAEAILATGKPVIVLLTNGRPLDLTWLESKATAIVETWYLGSQAGIAIADVLVGAYNPSGKLTMTFPYHPGQIPIYYNHFNTGRPLKNEGSKEKFLSKYIDGPNTPLYPFGYGLSYTQFNYSQLELSSDTLFNNDSLNVSIKITNVGLLDGEETVQLYIQDVAGSIVRPVRELKGFQKIYLEPNQTKEVVFTICEEDLKFYVTPDSFMAEEGIFNIMIGPNSRDFSSSCSFNFVNSRF